MLTWINANILPKRCTDILLVIQVDSALWVMGMRSEGHSSDVLYVSLGRFIDEHLL